MYVDIKKKEDVYLNWTPSTGTIYRAYNLIKDKEGYRRKKRQKLNLLTSDERDW